MRTRPSIDPKDGAEELAPRNRFEKALSFHNDWCRDQKWPLLDHDCTNSSGVQEMGSKRRKKVLACDFVFSWYLTRRAATTEHNGRNFLPDEQRAHAYEQSGEPTKSKLINAIAFKSIVESS